MQRCKNVPDKPAKNNVVKFEQLNVDLKNLETDTIKMPKLQEQNSMTLIKCLMLPSNDEAIICPEKAYREMITVFNRRFVKCAWDY